MDLSTQLLLVGAVSLVTPRVSNAACPPGHFSCHDDCCINEVQFCNNHDTQKRCQKCELRKTECGTPYVHEHCFVFCRDFLAANSTGASQTQGVLPPGIITAIIVPCVFVVIFASACVILIKRPAWLTRITRRSWYRLVCRGRTKENPVNSADRDVEAVPNEQPNLGDLSLRDSQHDEGTPLLDRSGGSPANGQAAEGTIEDTTVLASLHKRQSNGSLEPDTDPATSGDRGEAREAREAPTTSRVERPPALQTEALQQRDLSDADPRPSSRSPGGMTSSFSSAGTASGSDGAASSSPDSSQSFPSSAGTTSGAGRRSDNDSPRHRGEGRAERGDGGSTRYFHDSERPGARRPPGNDDSDPSRRQRAGNVIQANHTNIIMNFHPDTAHHRPAPPPADVTVSSPATSAYFVHNGGASPGGTNAHQASAGDGGNPSRQQQQNQNGSADQTHQCHDLRLHTNPTNPPDGDPGHRAEIATANDSQSTHQHYFHIPKPPA